MTQAQRIALEAILNVLDRKERWQEWYDLARPPDPRLTDRITQLWRLVQALGAELGTSVASLYQLATAVGATDQGEERNLRELGHVVRAIHSRYHDGEPWLSALSPVHDKLRELTAG